MNRGWRFCRFSGAVNRVVSCWFLSVQHRRSTPCLGTNGLHLDYGSLCLLHPALPLTPCNRLRGTGVLVRFVARIPDLIGREEMNLECIGCAGSQPFEFRVYLAGSLIQELRFPSVADRPLQHLSVGINSLQSRLCRQSANCVRPLMVTRALTGTTLPQPYVDDRVPV